MSASSIVSHRSRWWLYLLSSLILIFLVAPTFIVIPISFSGSEYLTFPPQSWSLKWYQNFFGSEEWMSAAKVSGIVAVLTVVVSVPLGTAAAYALHVSDVRFIKAIQAILILPIVVPTIFFAIGVFFLYIKLGLVNTKLGVVLAHSCLAMPLVVVTVLAGLKSFDMNLERAAQSLGANRFIAFLLVTLPQIRRSVVYSALFAFLTSLDEVIVGLFVSGGENTVITRKMFMALRDQVDPTIAAISSLLIVVSVSALAIAAALSKKSE